MQYIFEFQNRLRKNKLNVTVPLLSLGNPGSQISLLFAAVWGWIIFFK